MSGSRSIRLAVGVCAIAVGFAGPAGAAEVAEGWIDPDLARVINFTILASILVWAIRRPLSRYLDARTEAIRDQLSEARQARARAAAATEAAAAGSSSLDVDVEEVRTRIAESAATEGRRIIAAAEQEADRITAAAESELAAEVRLAESRLAASAAETVARITRARLEAGMSSRDHARLVEAGITAIRPPRGRPER